MFSIAFRYLCGFASAAHPRSREIPEWPPHPDRVFMALTAAHFIDNNNEQRLALEWLESRLSPSFCVSDTIGQHMAVPVYVPVNGDRSNMKNPIMVIPDKRKRDKRFFPAVIPENETVYLIYETELPSEHRVSLQSLCEKVGYLGDTSSLVQMWVDDNPPTATLVPIKQDRFALRLRVPYAGRLKDLEADYRRDCEAGEYRPRSFRWGYYAKPKFDTEALSASNYQMLIFRRCEGNTLDIRDALTLTEAFRGAVMTASVQPPPEWVSGHTVNGDRSENPHLAFWALPNVGHEHADGTLKGVALAVPKHVPQTEINMLLDKLLGETEPHPVVLRLGRAGTWKIEPDDSLRPLVTLDPHTWLGPAKRWATVTPISLDRFPKVEGDAEATIIRSCVNMGIPKPRDVIVLSSSLFQGVPPAKKMPLLPVRNRNGNHAHIHALLIFDQPVSGPVFLGAGRFRGYGLCRPYGGDL